MGIACVSHAQSSTEEKLHNGSTAGLNYLEMLADLLVTFSEALRAVREDGVEDRQRVREGMSRRFCLTALQAAKELGA